MTKFYKVIKENFLWDEGAILKLIDDGRGYAPVDNIFCKHENNDEYISKAIIENSPEYFQRVYAVNLLTKTVYKVKEEAKAILAEQFKN